MDFLIDNVFLILLALTSGGMLLWHSTSGGGAGAGKVSASEAVRLINREKAVLIDVSEAGDFAAGHPVGARSVPMATIESAKGLPTNKALPLVVVCPTGVRSGRAAAQLRKLGHERVVVLAGGMKAWREAGLPVTKEEKAEKVEKADKADKADKAGSAEKTERAA